MVVGNDSDGISITSTDGGGSIPSPDRQAVVNQATATIIAGIVVTLVVRWFA